MPKFTNFSNQEKASLCVDWASVLAEEMVRKVGNGVMSHGHPAYPLFENCLKFYAAAQRYQTLADKERLGF